MNCCIKVSHLEISRFRCVSLTTMNTAAQQDWEDHLYLRRQIIYNIDTLIPLKWESIPSISSSFLTLVVNSPHTCVPCPPWTSWWSAWSSLSGSPWRPGNTRCHPKSPFCPRNETKWCAGAGRCLAAGPGCREGCSSEPVWGFGIAAPPAEREDVRGRARYG